MMARRAPAARQAGFTLIEVLVAVAVFALLAATAYTALDALSRSAMQHRDRAAAFAAVQLGVARLDADLRQMVSRPVAAAAGTIEPALRGGSDRFEATRAGWHNPGSAPRSTLQRFGWTRSGSDLVRTAWPVTDRVAATRQRSETVLAGVKRFELRYLDAGGDWRERWPLDASVRELPRAIEVTLELEPLGRIRRLVVL
ncbi:MAG: type II secretion system minor pseudopilin GspJ [Pseudomonadota bacterium]|nr:MAG: type II secretion system minor pseudopilin GspJ [Pseudomonadota bacterium]